MSRSSTLRCVSPLQSVVDLGLGMFQLHEVQEALLLHWAVPLFSRGKREDQMLGGIYLCVVIVGSLWAGVVKRLGFSKHRSWSLELAGDNSFLKERKPPIPQHMFRDLGRPQGNFPEGLLKKQLQIWGKWVILTPQGLASTAFFFFFTTKPQVQCYLPPAAYVLAEPGVAPSQ